MNKQIFNSASSSSSFIGSKIYRIIPGAIECWDHNGNLLKSTDFYSSQDYQLEQISSHHSNQTTRIWLYGKTLSYWDMFKNKIIQVLPDKITHFATHKQSVYYISNQKIHLLDGASLYLGNVIWMGSSGSNVFVGMKNKFIVLSHSLEILYTIKVQGKVSSVCVFGQDWIVQTEKFIFGYLVDKSLKKEPKLVDKIDIESKSCRVYVSNERLFVLFDDGIVDVYSRSFQKLLSVQLNHHDNLQSISIRGNMILYTTATLLSVMYLEFLRLDEYKWIPRLDFNEWFDSQKKHDKLLDFGIILLTTCGINEYPSNLVQLKKTVNTILESQSESIQKLSLIYYLILDWSFELKEEYCQNFHLPSHYSNVIEGYWLLDHGHMDEAIQCFLKPGIKLDWIDLIHCRLGTKVLKLSFDAAPEIWVDALLRKQRISEAFLYIRQNCAPMFSVLLDYAVSNPKVFVSFIQLPLNPEEEKLFLDDCDVFDVVKYSYLVVRCRLDEAKRYESGEMNGLVDWCQKGKPMHVKPVVPSNRTNEIKIHHASSLPRPSEIKSPHVSSLPRPTLTQFNSLKISMSSPSHSIIKAHVKETHSRKVKGKPQVSIIEKDIEMEQVNPNEEDLMNSSHLEIEQVEMMDLSMDENPMSIIQGEQDVSKDHEEMNEFMNEVDILSELENQGMDNQGNEPFIELQTTDFDSLFQPLSELEDLDEESIDIIQNQKETSSPIKSILNRSIDKSPSKSPINMPYIIVRKKSLSPEFFLPKPSPLTNMSPFSPPRRKKSIKMMNSVSAFSPVIDSPAPKTPKKSAKKTPKKMGILDSNRRKSTRKDIDRVVKTNEEMYEDLNTIVKKPKEPKSHAIKLIDSESFQPVGTPKKTKPKETISKQGNGIESQQNTPRSTRKSGRTLQKTSPSLVMESGLKDLEGHVTPLMNRLNDDVPDSVLRGGRLLRQTLARMKDDDHVKAQTPGKKSVK